MFIVLDNAAAIKPATAAWPSYARLGTLLKAHLCKAAERTIHGLWNAIGRILRDN
jgi:hypothetical protein